MPQRPHMSLYTAIQILARNLPEPRQHDRRSGRRRALDARRLEIQQRLQAGERRADLALHLGRDARIGEISSSNLGTLLHRTGILADAPDPQAPSDTAWTSGHGPVTRNR